MVEHLVSALYGLAIDNAVVESPSYEIPFFDGSSRVFVEALKNNTINQFCPVKVIEIRMVMRITLRNTFIEISPGPGLVISLSQENRYLGVQRLSLSISKKHYIDEIAAARTFAVVSEADPRLAKLPSYGIGITKSGIYSRAPLRFEDEFVRHKMLDLLGDLSILGYRLRGKIAGYNVSHRLNHKLVREIVTASTPS